MVKKELSERQLLQRRTAALKTGKYSKTKVLYWASMDFHYGEKWLEKGEVMELEDFRNDDKLIVLSYLRKLSKEPVGCEFCPKQFVDSISLLKHLSKHSGEESK